MLRSLFNRGRAQALNEASGQSPERERAPSTDAPHAGIDVLSIMCSKEHEDMLETIASDQHWSFARARTWSESLSAVAAGAGSIVVIDRAHIRAEWREMLAFLLRPEHHCRVILIDTTESGHLLRDEFLDRGGHLYLQPPVKQTELISAIHDAADFWQKIDRAYRRESTEHCSLHQAGELRHTSGVRRRDQVH
jgi:DNA-binding NtrC family response regulator